MLTVQHSHIHTVGTTFILRIYMLCDIHVLLEIGLHVVRIIAKDVAHSSLF